MDTELIESIFGLKQMNSKLMFLLISSLIFRAAILFVQQ